MELGKSKEVKLEVGEQKNKLSNLSKLLAKKASGREKLTALEYSNVKQCIKVSNSLGLRMVEKQQTVEALDLLKQAENVGLLLLRIVEQSAAPQGGKGENHVLKLLANTYNNIGYLFSQAGNMDNAYAYLLRTLDAETRGEYSSYRKGLTCLNISNLLISKNAPTIST